MAVYGIFSKKNKFTWFFLGILIISLLFALPTPMAKLPFIWNIPFINTSQPTRLVFLIDFSLSILAAVGINQFIMSFMNEKKLQEKEKKKLMIIIVMMLMIFTGFWLSLTVPNDEVLISLRNLILPSVIFITISFLIILILKVGKLRVKKLILSGLILLLLFDLFRFGWKFTPFSTSSWLYPETEIIKRLKSDKSFFRIMSLDRRILAPNFSIFHRIKDVSGYDPLYLRKYGELVASWDRNKPDITPASFNRIITPVNFQSFLTNFLGVKYLLSYGPLDNSNLNLEIQEGQSFLYSNPKHFPYAYFVEEVIKVETDQEEIEKMYELGEKLKTVAISQNNINLVPKPLTIDEEVKLKDYQEGQISLETNSGKDRLLLISEIYYPSRKVYLDGQPTHLYQVDYTFSGLVVPAGRHQIKLETKLL